MTYGENHCVLHTEQLQKKGNQVDRAGTTRESDRVRITAKEVGLTEIWFGFLVLILTEE